METTIKNAQGKVIAGFKVKETKEINLTATAEKIQGMPVEIWTIKEQLGHKCLYMLGAENFVYSYTNKRKSLTFKIRGSKKVTHIRIALTAWDLYKVTFFYMPRKNVKIVAELDGIYNDQLHELIEKYTGLYTKLF